MTLRGRLVAAAGTLAVVTGLLFVVRPALAVALPEIPSLLVGLLALVQGARILSSQRGRAIEGATTPDPEVAETFARPGDEFDAVFARTRGRRRSDRYDRERVRDQLESVAIDVLVRRRTDSSAAARRLLDEGTWTDDPYAAAFFAGGRADVSLRERLSHSVSRESRFQRRARHAIAAVDRYAYPEGDDDGR